MIYKLKQNRVGRTYLGGSRIDRFTSRKFDNHGDIPHPEDWLASVTSVVNGGVSEGLGGTEDGISITLTNISLIFPSKFYKFGFVSFIAL